MDKIIASAGPMCPTSFQHIGPIDEASVWDVLDYKKNAFVHFVNDGWIFNGKKFWSWTAPIGNAGAKEQRWALKCVGGNEPRSQLFMPWGFVPSADAWDMRIKFQPFFDILRQMVIMANKCFVKPVICIGNECDERKPERKNQSPYFHNVNGFVGLYARESLPFWGTLTDWILEALVGTDFSIELINEGHRRGSGSGDVVNMMFPRLLAAGVPSWNISLGADILDTSLAGFQPVSDWKQRWPNELQPPNRENYDIFIDRNHLVKYYDAKYPNATHEVFYLICHNFADKADKEHPDVFPYGRRTGYAIEAGVDRNLANNRVCFSTDGTDNADAPSGRPSPERMKAAMLYVMRHNKRYKDSSLIDGRPKLWFDFLPGGESIPNIVKVVDAMNEAHREFFGVDLENRGKVPTYEEVYPDTPDTTIPPITNSDDKPPFDWRGEWNNKIAWIKAHPKISAAAALAILIILFWIF